MIPTPDQLKAFVPKSAIASSFLGKLETDHGLTTPKRWAMWLTMAAVESAMFTKTAEDLNYSAAGLANTWPSKFSSGKRDTRGRWIPNRLAVTLAHNPQAIANTVYANKYGNGNAATNDGWNFRGGGWGQLTWRPNYEKASKALYGDLTLIKTPRIIELMPAAVWTFGWFFETHGCLASSDAQDVSKCRGQINGPAKLGLDLALKLYPRACRALKV